VAASLFAAVGALVALLDRERTGRSRWIDISVQECVAQALEDSVATYDLTGHVRVRLGSDPREAGSGIYPCADGYVAMVAGRLGTARAWQALVEWLIEDSVDGAVELGRSEWSKLEFRQRPDSIDQFSEVFVRFAGRRTRQELYTEAQRRGIALSPVNEIVSVLDDRQLAARGFFVSVRDPVLDAELTYPGAPYRLSATPASPARPAPALGADTRAVLGELGLDDDACETLIQAGIA
jgi:benzylsuccinate CoA-transferase BbsE subunit